MIKQGTNILKEHSKKRLEFNPELKQINFLDRRVYQRSEGVFYPSVTTILQYMPKNKFFEQWIKDVGHNADLIMRRAGKEGTQVHEAAEQLVLGEEVSWMDDFGKARYSQIVWEMILKFYDFWETFKPELISSEDFVWSDKYKYAGTADLVVKMNNETWLLDIKTSNSIHKSFDLQLASYAKALEESRGIKIDRTGIIWLKAHTRGPSKQKNVIQGKGWKLLQIDDIDKNFKLFQNIYNLYMLDHPTTEPIYYKYPTTLKIGNE